MEPKGDIPERDEIEPDNITGGDLGAEAQAKANVVQEVLDNGGVAHVYLSHTDVDYHLYDFNTHVFPDKGMVFFHADDEDHWVFAGDIEMIERHYEA